MNKNIFNYILFFVPLLYLGQTYNIVLLRIAVFSILLVNFLFNKNKKAVYRHSLPIILLILSSLYYAWRKHHFVGCLPSIELIIYIYFSLCSGRYTKNDLNSQLNYLFKGFSFAGIVGFSYMCLTKTFIKGGTFTENPFNISNLTVPLYFSLYIIYSVLTISGKRKIRKIIVLLFYFGVVIFLEKRGAILFLIMVLLLYLLKCIYQRYIRFSKIILVVIFIFPLYELPLTEYIIESGFVDRLFERSSDFNDIEENPRISRLLAANSFITDFQPVDIIGFHDEIQLSKIEDDLVHEHFHNTFLQLYYERGLVAIILFIVLICQLKLDYKRGTYSDIIFISLLFLLLVGTNEDILITGSLWEIIIYYFLLYNYNDIDIEEKLE